jgi:hypothetical protein
MGHCPPVLRRHIFDPLLSELCKPRAFQSYIRTEEKPAIGDGLQAGRKRAHEDAAKAYGESRRSCVSRWTLWTTKRAPVAAARSPQLFELAFGTQLFEAACPGWA